MGAWRRGGGPRALRSLSQHGVVALIGLAAWGCSFSATFDSPPLYRLVSVDDERLPATPGFGVTVLSGTFELGSEGECVHTQRVRIGEGPGAQESTWRLECEWSRIGDDLELTFAPVEYAQSLAGVLRGETLQLTRDTGIRCVTTPCPAIWIEEYQRDRSGA